MASTPKLSARCLQGKLVLLLFGQRPLVLARIKRRGQRKQACPHHQLHHVKGSAPKDGRLGAQLSIVCHVEAGLVYLGRTYVFKWFPKGQWQQLADHWFSSFQGHPNNQLEVYWKRKTAANLPKHVQHSVAHPFKAWVSTENLF